MKMSEKSQSLVISKREIWICVRHVAPCNSKMGTSSRYIDHTVPLVNYTFPAMEARGIRDLVANLEFTPGAPPLPKPA